MQLDFVSRYVPENLELANGIRSPALAALPEGNFLYTANTEGLCAFRLTSAGLTEVSHLFLSQGLMTSATVEVASIKDEIYLFFADGSGVDSVAIGADGRLDARTPLNLDLGGQVSAVNCVQIGDEDFVFAIEAGELRGFRVTDTGQLVALPGGSDNASFNVPIVADMRVGDLSFLLVSEGTSGLLHAYSIAPATGAVAHISTVGAADGIGIAGITEMATVTAFDQSFVILASSGSSSISVMRLDADGILEPTEHLVDTFQTRFGGAQSVALIEVEGQVFVVAGGADDGLSIFTLLPDGRLLHLQSLTDAVGLGLANVSGITVTQIGDNLQVYVASETRLGLSEFRVSLADLGQIFRALADGPEALNGTDSDDLLFADTDAPVTLSGGDGDDILVAAGMGETLLWGGPGADVFVLSESQSIITIGDFDRQNDQLDLSDFRMLRGVGQLNVMLRSDGAELMYQDTVVQISSNDNNPLSMEDILGSMFSWPDRILVLAEDTGAAFYADAAGGFIAGTDQDDMFYGASGSDILWSQGGHDVVYGAGGADDIGGGDGQDTLYGGGGADLLFGGNGADVLDGGAAADRLWGGAGTDVIRGGLGKDSIGGSLDNDLLWGGQGGDLIFGGAGQDSLHGEEGEDTLWSGIGDDLAFGGIDNDTLGGGLGADTLNSGSGHDLLFGGAGFDSLSGQGGRDTLYAGTGNDTLDGGSWHDVLSGGTGDDVLTGGGGRDVFGFGLDQGQDIITDFRPGEDMLHLWSGAIGFDDLSIGTTARGEAIITMGSGRIVLANVAPELLSADDFLFL